MESDQIWNQVAKFMQQLRGENLSKKSIIQIPGQNIDCLFLLCGMGIIEKDSVANDIF